MLFFIRLNICFATHSLTMSNKNDKNKNKKIAAEKRLKSEVFTVAQAFGGSDKSERKQCRNAATE